MAATARTLAASVSLAARPVAPGSRRAAARAPARSSSLVVRAEGATAEAAEATEIYEVTLDKPVALQLKFARGNDGGAYCVFVPDDPTYDAFEIGDKILAVSASFGNEIWDADSYGQVIYAMKNRNGDIYLKMKKMNGDFSALEQSEKSSQMKAERAGGNYGAGTKEQQMQNYSKKKELEVQRLDMFDEAISLYNKKDYDNALIIFEEVAALEPKNFMSDNFQTATEVYKVTMYNIACCFSKLGQPDNSLQALKKCMGAGWTDYKKIRTDPSLAEVRQAPGFKPMINKFDEPLINENAVKFMKGIFGGNK
jgi:tetratricopeptide (TPR) repeat protein